MLVPELIWTLCRLLRCSSDSCGEVKHACRKNTIGRLDGGLSSLFSIRPRGFEPSDLRIRRRLDALCTEMSTGVQGSTDVGFSRDYSEQCLAYTCVSTPVVPPKVPPVQNRKMCRLTFPHGVQADPYLSLQPWHRRSLLLLHLR